MGYSYRFGTEIQTFWPDDDDKTMYLASSGFLSLGELIGEAQDKWPDATIADITIEAENIHTDCLTYDLHDAGDYTQFIVLKYNK